MMTNWTSIAIAIISFITLRIILVINNHRRGIKPKLNLKDNKCSISFFLGSGGHSTEMLKIISSLPFTKFSPRLYLVSSGDTLSAQKCLDLENERKADAMGDWGDNGYFELHFIKRTRKVNQSLLTTPFTFLITLLQGINLSILPPPDISSPSNANGRQNSIHDLPPPQYGQLLVMNGPATSVPLVLSVWLAKFIGLPHPRMIYIESWTRVTSLSLTGKIVKPLVDTFITQWDENNDNVEDIEKLWMI